MAAGVQAGPHLRAGDSDPDGAARKLRPQHPDQRMVFPGEHKKDWSATYKAFNRSDWQVRSLFQPVFITTLNYLKLGLRRKKAHGGRHMPRPTWPTPKPGRTRHPVVKNLNSTANHWSVASVLFANTPRSPSSNNHSALNSDAAGC